FILSGRHGSGASLLDEGVFARYLELELFAAAALQKPILVLHYAGASLFRLWAAMRELITSDPAVLADAAVLPLWDRALGLWASQASWIGLHGHLWMGPLAAINTQAASWRAARRRSGRSGHTGAARRSRKRDLFDCS